VALYTNDSKERVRDAVDMIDLVNARTELKRAGVNRYTGLCPFHDERTPSFGINPADKVYYCFGCQASGDAFTFVMETEGVDFKSAIELLADRYKIALELEDEDPQAAERRQRNERLMELLERTATFYVRQLWESAEAARAREYLASRGLEEGALREFRVGYAPSAWDTVMKASLRARFKAQELDAAGLLSSNEKSGRKYDRFRTQVIFPLADARGRVRGFAGRTLVPDSERRGPKYVNSPESHLFHKREQLFGADIARAAAAKAGTVVVAEGYTDVIAMHQAGIRNSVAIMGTAMTEEQLAGLARLAPVMRLALDSDSAGKEAMLRTARLAKNRRVEIEVVALVAGEDPADLVHRAGAEELVTRIAEAVPFVRFSVHRAIETGDLDDARGKDQVLDAISAMWKLVPSGVEHDELVRTISNRLDLPPDLVAGELSRRSATAPLQPRPDPAGGAGDAAPRVATALGRRERTERAFLGYCLALPKLGAPALAQLDLDADLSSPVIRRAAAHLRAHLDAPTEDLPDHDPELAGLIAELAVRATELPASPAAFEAERLQLGLARLDREIAAARSAAAGDVSKLAGRRSAMQTQLSGALARAMEEGERAR
jgi:DNA primase